MYALTLKVRSWDKELAGFAELLVHAAARLCFETSAKRPTVQAGQQTIRDCAWSASSHWQGVHISPALHILGLQHLKSLLLCNGTWFLTLLHIQSSFANLCW